MSGIYKPGMLRTAAGRQDAYTAASAQPSLQRTNPSALRELLMLLVKLAAIAATLLIAFTFLFGIVRYQEPSMSPAIKDGDLVIFYRYNRYGYHSQDVVALAFQGRMHVRRVVATAGDMVDIIDGGLLVNGAPQHESGVYQRTERYQEGVEFPLMVPEGEVFVLGDSRFGAADSRIYGCVRIQDTLGKVIAVIRRRGI